ncbi:hypothetical protein [Streptacidiphilus sp. EB129]|uniref:hypothetical protein n=1 Tax=Streptacidiphilus sp. EB129 TaxID=3156262 RepID=UPI003514168C
MTTPRDMPGYPLTADDIHRAEAALGDDEHDNPPEPRRTDRHGIRIQGRPERRSIPMTTVQYRAEVNVRPASGGDLITIYHDTTGPAGIPASEIRATAEAAALAQEPGGKVVGSRVSCDGTGTKKP